MPNILSNLSNSVGAYVPSLVAALVLLVVALLVAAVARIVVRRLARASHIEERCEASGIADALGQGAFWLVILISLPGLLAALRLHDVLQPIQAMVSRFLGFLPNLLGATLIFVVGWFVAGLVRKIITSLLHAAGLDTFGSKMGLSLGDRYQLSGIIGLVAYVLLLIPFIVGALSALSLDAVSGPFSAMMNAILASIPNIFAAALILGISYVLGRLVASLITNVLAGLGFDRIPPKLGFKDLASKDKWSASKVVGTLALVAILLLGATEASRVLGFAALSTLIRELTVFGGQLLMGLVIFCVGLFLANLAASSILASDTENPKLFASIARFAILFIVTAMALGQMGLAKDIVNLAFGLLLGAIAVAVALAFGLGGRDTAGRIVSEMHSAVRSPSLDRLNLESGTRRN